MKKGVYICKGKVTSDGMLLPSKGMDFVNNASRERGNTLVVGPGDTFNTCSSNKCRLKILNRGSADNA